MPRSAIPHALPGSSAAPARPGPAPRAKRGGVVAYCDRHHRAARLLPAHHAPADLNGGPVMRTPIPWIALAAVALMFLLPWLDAHGVFDGPRTIRHRPRREVCADCAQPWTPDHQCPGWLDAAAREPVVPLHPVEPHALARGRAQLTRTHQPAQPGQPAWRALPQRERRP
jgi:hypothetical protein